MIKCDYIGIKTKEENYVLRGDLSFEFDRGAMDSDGYCRYELHITAKKNIENGVSAVTKYIFDTDKITRFAYTTDNVEEENDISDLDEPLNTTNDDYLCSKCAHKPSNGISTNAVCIRCKDGGMFVSAFKEDKEGENER